TCALPICGAREPHALHPRTRTAVPNSYGARYELGTHVRVRVPGGGHAPIGSGRAERRPADPARLAAGKPQRAELVHPHPPRMVHATSSAPGYELASPMRTRGP